jgi:hypothetical protein
MGNLKIEISIGEALDRLTILKIKLQRIKDEKKLANVAREFENLRESIINYAGKTVISPEYPLFTQLMKVNEELWDVEDKLRELEREKDFSIQFVGLARSVYILNDNRANIKKEINISNNSELIEEKSYEAY